MLEEVGHLNHLRCHVTLAPTLLYQVVLKSYHLQLDDLTNISVVGTKKIIIFSLMT